MFSDGNSFEDIMKRCLDKIDDSLDKRMGSIIYDAIAPAAMELATCYTTLDEYTDQVYLLTTSGENLDKKAVDYGVTRNAATKAQRYAIFVDNQDTPAAMSVEIGTRFSEPNEYGGLVYKVIEATSTTGQYIVECETAGSLGNSYFGMLLPLQTVNNLGQATLGNVYIAGEDTETDDSLRNRIIHKLNETPFGGNVADYKEYVEDIDGIGACLVIPVWNGGGTVKLVILTSSYEIPTAGKIAEVQTLVDPVANHGEGLGEAPIGHTVTVVGPTAYNLTIECDVYMKDGYTLIGQKEAIEKAVNDYIKEIQQDWANSSSSGVTIYISMLIAAIALVEGVANVTNLTINNEDDDVTIVPTSSGNPFPVIEEIVLNEGE